MWEEFLLEFTGGYGPYSCGAVGLPEGLEIEMRGSPYPEFYISGTPAYIESPGEVYECSVWLRVAYGVTGFDEREDVVTLTLRVNVVPPLEILTEQLPDATVGEFYSHYIEVQGGEAPYGWLVEPALPDGLDISTSNGRRLTLSGIPAAISASEDPYVFALFVVDSHPDVFQFAEKTFELAIHAPDVTILTAALPGATEGVSYDESLAAVTTLGSISTTVRCAAGLCLYRNLVCEPAPRPICKTFSGKSPSRSNNAAIITRVYSNARSKGWSMRIAPCIHAEPKCSERSPSLSLTSTVKPMPMPLPYASCACSATSSASLNPASRRAARLNGPRKGAG